MKITGLKDFKQLIEGWKQEKKIENGELIEENSKEIKEKEFMYLVHSFYVPLSVNTVATTNYEKDYSTALQCDNFFGVQFHPEKSGTYGQQILKNFLNL